MTATERTVVTMTPRQVELVRETFAQVAPGANGNGHRLGEQVSEGQARAFRHRFGQAFYENLFRAYPGMRPLFSIDVPRQSQKLMDSFAVIVETLDNPEALLPYLGRLGQNHVNYGVVAEDYDAMKDVLLETMAQQLGEEFTDEAAAAWDAAYERIAELMTRSAEPVPGL